MAAFAQCSTAAHIPAMFAGLTLSRRPVPGHGIAGSLAMRAKHTFHVEVAVGDDEPQDNAVKRFRRAVMGTGLIQEARRRRRFEDAQDVKKRKAKEISQRNSKARKSRVYPTPTFDETSTFEPAPFADLFGEPEEDLFPSDVVPSFSRSRA